jgi:hypothetical protein
MPTGTSTNRALTTRQREWLSHLEAWREQGGSLKAYALAHGLSQSALYSARRVLTQRGIWQGRRRELRAHRAAPKLVPVRVRAMAPAMAMFRVLLPNGIVIEVPEQADPARCQALVAGLSEAPA